MVSFVFRIPLSDIFKEVVFYNTLKIFKTTNFIKCIVHEKNI